MQAALYVLECIIKRKSVHVRGVEIRLGNSKTRNQVNMLQLPQDKIVTSLSVNEADFSLRLKQNS